MKTVFVNQNSEGTIIEAGERHLNSRSLDLRFYSEFAGIDDIDDLKDQLRRGNYSFAEIRDNLRMFEDLGPFNEYGLSYDYVELGTFDDQEEDYFRFQFSWGGPSEEVRFYEDGSITFVYLDWFSGVGFDVTGEDEFKFLRSWFNDCCMMDFSAEREKYDYYEQLDRIVNPDDYEEDVEETEEEDE